MAPVSLRKLHKRFGKTEVIHGVDLEVADGEFVVLVGPSGCGKSTTLRIIAGLEEASGGEIAIAGRVVNNLEPKDRDIAMVFQNYAIYPHMTVYRNIGFGLHSAKLDKTEKDKRIREAATVLDLTDLLDRRPSQLSGGQRQRVAIGRAMVRDPSVFLFDEPLSNLDAQLRAQMRLEIKKLHQNLNSTIIFVTHDQIEAMTLADKIVLLRDGEIEQQGSPLDLFERPATRFVAGFLGSPQMNFVATRLDNIGGAPTLVFDEDRKLPLDPARAASFDEWRGRDVIFGVRPEHMSRSIAGAPRKPAEAPVNVLIDLIQPTGTRTYAQYRLNGTEVTVELPSHTVERPGTTIELLVDMSRIILIDPQTENVIPG